MAEKKCPATVRVYFDNVNSESYQTFLAYCDHIENTSASRWPSSNLQLLDL